LFSDISPGETSSDSSSYSERLKKAIPVQAGIYCLYSYYFIILNRIMIGFNALVGFSVASLASPLVSFAKDKEKVWSKVDLQIKDTLFDISFDPSKPAHGWLVGAKV